jgi:hypothetical protein
MLDMTLTSQRITCLPFTVEENEVSVDNIQQKKPAVAATDWHEGPGHQAPSARGRVVRALHDAIDGAANREHLLVLSSVGAGIVNKHSDECNDAAIWAVEKPRELTARSVSEAFAVCREVRVHLEPQSSEEVRVGSVDGRPDRARQMSLRDAGDAAVAIGAEDDHGLRWDGPILREPLPNFGRPVSRKATGNLGREFTISRKRNTNPDTLVRYEDVLLRSRSPGGGAGPGAFSYQVIVILEEGRMFDFDFLNDEAAHVDIGVGREGFRERAPDSLERMHDTLGDECVRVTRNAQHQLRERAVVAGAFLYQVVAHCSTLTRVRIDNQCAELSGRRPIRQQNPGACVYGIPKVFFVSSHQGPGSTSTCQSESRFMNSPCVRQEDRSVAVPNRSAAPGEDHPR